MSETESAARASMDGGNAPSAATVEAFKATMARYNLDPGPTLRSAGLASAEEMAAHSEAQEAALDGDAADDAIVDPNAHTGSLDPATKVPSLNARELNLAAENLRKFWTGDPAVLAAALKNAGYRDSIAAASTEDAPDAALAPPASASAYDIDGIFVGREFEPGADLPALHGALRATMKGMQIPLGVAKSFAGALLDAVQSGYSTQTSDAARVIYSNEQTAIACNVLHVGRAELLATAKLAVDGIPKAYRDEWAQSGAFENSAVLVAAYQAGLAIKSRR